MPVPENGTVPALPARQMAARAKLARVTATQPVPAPGPSRRVQAFLRRLDDLSFAALLRELGHRLYEKDVREWRSMIDISDELVDRVTFSTKNHAFDLWLTRERQPLARASGRDQKALRAAKRKSRRRA